MTGEITLRGQVLPIGGVKEKMLAAHRAGIRTLILPDRNRKDLPRCPPDVQRQMEFVFVDHMDAVLPVALHRRPEIRPRDDELHGHRIDAGVLAAAGAAGGRPSRSPPPGTPLPARTMPNTDVNPWGTNTFLHKEVETWKKQQTFKMIQEAGIGWVKQQFPWEEIEQPRKGEFFDRKFNQNTWDKFDEMVKLAESAGARYFEDLGCCACRASTGKARGCRAGRGRFSTRRADRARSRSAK